MTMYGAPVKVNDETNDDCRGHASARYVFHFHSVDVKTKHTLFKETSISYPCHKFHRASVTWNQITEKNGINQHFLRHNVFGLPSFSPLMSGVCHPALTNTATSRSLRRLVQFRQFWFWQLPNLKASRVLKLKPLNVVSLKCNTVFVVTLQQIRVLSQCYNLR